MAEKEKKIINPNKGNKLHHHLPRNKGGMFCSNGEPNKKHLSIMIKPSVYNRYKQLGGEQYTVLIREALDSYLEWLEGIVDKDHG